MSEKSNLKFYIRDDGIMVFKFFEMHRRAADEFAIIVRAGMKNPPRNLRVIYDFSEAPPPTPYFLKLQGTLYNEFPHPPNERSAYITGIEHSDVWVRILRSYVTAQDIMRTFTTIDDAVAWLLA